MGEAMTDIYDKIKGHAVTQSDAGPRPDTCAEPIIDRGYFFDTRTPEQKQPGPNYVPIGGAGNGA
jgi:hypothetical protein